MYRYTINNSNKNSNSNGGIGFTGLLTILFIALKLLGVIEWSWLWVLSPIWLTILLIVFLVFIL